MQTMKRTGWVLVVAMAGALAACGGGGSSDSIAANDPAPPAPPQPVETGDLAIAVTDAEGDFVVYEVEVERIDLRTAAGDAVQTIPANARIDFAELTELSELLTVASVPTGVYTSVTLQLDFTDAVVMVQDAAGIIREAVLQDAAGDPLGAVPVTVTLGDDSPVRIGAATPARISLDFDLDASNEILSFDPAVVLVEPFLFAAPEFDGTRDLRVHGALEEVADGGEITIEVQPLRQRPATIGSVTFTTDAETIWEIDDAGFVGDAGLVALADVAPGTAVIAAGPVAAGDLVADLMLVGTAVPGVTSDVVAGAVLARDGDVLTLGGVRVHSFAGPDVFLRRATLIVDAETLVKLRVSGARAGEVVGTDALSIGSRVVAEAIRTDDGDAASTELPAFDASGSRAWLRRSALTAEVVSADPLVVDLVRLDGRRPGVFDFAGTGASALDDADPDAYEIDPGVLATDTLVPEDIVRVRGLVAAFGSAPEDFDAETLIDVEVDDRAARLRASWAEIGGSADALFDIAGDAVSVDLSEAAAALRVRGILRNVLPDDALLALVPASQGPVQFAIRTGPAGDIRVFEAFSAFADALLADLQAGALLEGLAAEGRYDRAESRLTVRRVRVQWAP